MNMFGREVFLTQFRNDYIVSDNMLPVRQHQANDELMKLKKELGASLRLQRDREGRYP